MKHGALIAIALCCISAVLGIYAGTRGPAFLTALPPAQKISWPTARDFEGPPRIGLIDMQRLIEAHPKTSLATSEINVLRDQAVAEMQCFVDRGDKSGATKFRTVREKELQIESARLRADIIADLKARIPAIVSKHGLTLLLDSSGKSLNNVPVVMQSPGLIDVTDEILRELNR